MTRPGTEPSDVPEWLLEKANFRNIPDLEVSSTLVRELVGKGWDVRRLVPEGVADLISRYHLYHS